MTSSSPINGLIHAARRRSIVQLVIEQFSWGLTAGLAAFSLLLLVGSAIFRWYWPLLLLALTAAVGWWRSRNRIPSPYRVAQSVDESLGLNDLVSTAFHFDSGAAARTPDHAFLATVQARAESAAAQANPRAAVPYAWPRAAWFASATLGIAVVLFTVRYGVLRTFDLRAPIAAVSFDTLTGAPKPSPKQLAQKAAKLPDLEGIAVEDPEGTGVQEKETTIQESLRSVDVNDPNKVGAPGTGEQAKAADQDESGESSEDGDPGTGNNKKKLPEGVEEIRTPSDSSQAQKAGQQQKDNSLLDKMRDAMANLMDKLKMEAPSGESKQASNKNAKGQQKGEKGPPQKGKGDRQNDPNESQPGDQQSDADAQQAQSSQPGDQDPASNQEKSGVGKQDGKKDTELAEQQEAMGKLSEILGKRALSVQAEVMVEVTNSKNQQLRTPYVNRTGRHIESGSDLNRDEVPLHLQDYVQRYYQQVRKPAPPAAAPKQ